MDEPQPAPPPEPAPSSRDASGRFAAGNPGGPGRPNGRTNELQRAAVEAVTAEHVQALMRVAVRQGLQGNLQATRLVLDRSCGKAPNPVNATPLDIDLQDLRTAEACASAIDKIVAAVTAGIIDTATGKFLLDAVVARMKAIELNDFGERLDDLEKAAESVELPRSGRRP